MPFVAVEKVETVKWTDGLSWYDNVTVPSMLIGVVDNNGTFPNLSSECQFYKSDRYFEECGPHISSTVDALDNYGDSIRYFVLNLTSLNELKVTSNGTQQQGPVVNLTLTCTYESGVGY
jgi:hypothetical protein